VYDAGVLLEVLEELHREWASDPDPDDNGLGDFGETLVPRFVDRGRAVVHPLPGYWRDLGQPHHYLNAHLELLGSDLDLFRRDWPIRTQQPQREAARVLEGASISDALLSPGCVVAGSVVRSVLGPGVVIEAGAEVVESVILADTTVGSGATVARSIVDSGCELHGEARVGDVSAALDGPDDIAIIGRECRVGSPVKPGARLAPGSTA
jgi:glucose-1-phosphate adenylyltransferase